MLRRLKYVGVAVIAALALATILTISFPVATRLPLLVVKHESVTALKELVDYVAYLHVQFSALEWNEEKGLKEFVPAVMAEGGREHPDRLRLGRLEWHRGNFAAAVREIERHHAEEGESEASLFWLAMSYLRQGEAENCLEALGSHPAHDAQGGGMCTLPLEVYHDEDRYSRTAASLFERLLDEYDGENRLYRWLLSFALMTVGDFPAGVPARYELGPEFVSSFYGERKAELAARYSGLHFSDQAAALGVATFDAGKGVAVEDFDRDGFLDIVTGGMFDPLRLYWNDGGGRFVERSEELGLGGVRGVHIITAADYDNDGWIDLFVSRPMGSELGDFVLLRNLEGRGFTDVTVAMGLLEEPGLRELYTLTWMSAWGDIDNDGDLDLFVANWGFYTTVGAERRLNPLMGNRDSALYRNDGDRFVDVSKESGVAEIVAGRNVYGAAFGDYDNDGLVDLAFTPQWLPGIVLARNAGGGRFEPTDLLDADAWGFMTAFVDVNHDGRLDLYVGSTGQAPGVTRQSVFGEGGEDYRTASSIWLQQSDGRFVSREDFFPDGMPLATMGTSFGDLNNDGAYDFYIGTGSPEGWMVLPNLLYIGVSEDGRPTGRTEHASMLHGFGNLQKGHGIVFFDFDEDGDQDVYSSLGGLWPGDRWPNQLFVNDSELEGSTWTKIRLRGRRSNYYGVGARLKIRVETTSGAEQAWHYYMDNKTGFGSAPYLAHLGFADAARILDVEVLWPGDSTPTRYSAGLETTNLLDQNGSAQASLGAVTRNPARAGGG